MNDLTISRSSLDQLNQQKTPVQPLSNSLEASDLSFRKIQAAAQPLLAKLRNAGLIAEINWVAQEEKTESLILSKSNTDGGYSTLFFGSAFISSTITPADDLTAGFNILELIEDESKLVLGVRGVYGSHLTTDDTVVGASVQNALIMEAIMSNCPSATMVAVGMLISLTRPIMASESLDTYDLGYWVTNTAEETKSPEHNSTKRGVLNFWDASAAPNGVPSFLSPKKVGHYSAATASFPTRYRNGRLVRPSFLKGTIIPKNFFAFLQSVRAQLEGSQLQPTVYSEAYDMNSLDGMIQDIAVAVSQGIIRLGTNPSLFVVPSFTFVEPRLYVDPNSSPHIVSAHFGFDPIESGTIALNYLTTVRSVVGSAMDVISLTYPVKTSSGTDQAIVAYDLIQMNIKEITVNLPLTKTLTATATHLSPIQGQRSLSQYASGFSYPEPLVNLS